MVEQENLFFLTLYKLPWQSMANISKLLWSLIRFHCRWTSSAWKRGMEKQQYVYQLHPFYSRNTDGSTGNHKSESQQARWMVDVLFQLRNFHSKFYAPRPLFYRWYASASILQWYALVIMSKTSTPLKIPQLQSWKQAKSNYCRKTPQLQHFWINDGRTRGLWIHIFQISKFFIHSPIIVQHRHKANQRTEPELMLFWQSLHWLIRYTYIQHRSFYSIFINPPELSGIYLPTNFSFI